MLETKRILFPMDLLKLQKGAVYQPFMDEYVAAMFPAPHGSQALSFGELLKIRRLRE